MIKIFVVIFLLVAPVVAYGIAYIVRQGYEGQYHAYLAKEYGDKALEFKARLPLSELCAEQRRSGDEQQECVTYRAAGLTKAAAAGAAAGGLLLFALIGAAGYLCRFNRKVLLHVFRPGLYITILAALALVVLHAALAMTAIYLFSTYVIVFWFMILFLLIGFGAVLGCIAIARGTFAIFRRPAYRVFGKKLPPEEQPEFYATINELAAKIGVAPPDHIVAGFDINFFVTEGKVECHDRRLWGRTLYVSLPCCRILSREELLAILGHELGHFKGLDTEFGKKFSPFFRVGTECLARLQDEMADSRAIALFPAYYLLAYFLESFDLADSKLNRERELAADAVGAELFGATNAATGLVKIHAFMDDVWESFRYWLRDAVVADQTLRNGSVRFVEDAANRWGSAFYGLDERQTPHPLNSHPTLKERLEALHLNVSQLVEQGLVNLPEKPSIELIAGYAKIEEDLTAIKCKSMVKAREIPTQKSCPACRRQTPFSTELCECGFNFLRLPVG